MSLGLKSAVGMGGGGDAWRREAAAELDGSEGRKLFQELRNPSDDRRRGAAAALREFVEAQTRALSGEQFTLFMDALNARVFELVNSEDIPARLGGIAAIDELIDVCTEKNEMEIIRYANYLRMIFQSPASLSDSGSLVAASKVMGKLARAGGTLTADFVEFEIRRALEWLEGEERSSSSAASARRLAAVLVLQELAKNASTLFYTHVNPFMKHVWVAIHDSRVTTREAACDALAACLTVIAQRDSSLRLQWYYKVLEQVQAGLRKGNADSIHGSLLTIDQLLSNTTRGFVEPRYSELCDTVLKYKDHRDRLVRRTVIALLSRLAKFSPGRLFVDHYLEFGLAHVLSSLRHSSDRTTAYLSLGQLVVAVGDAARPHLPAIMPLVQEGLSLKGRRTFSHAALTCVSQLAAGLGPALEPYLPDLLSQMFSAGLTTTLIEALTALVKSVPSAADVLREQLMDELSFVLADAPFTPPGMPERQRPDVAVRRARRSTDVPVTPSWRPSKLLSRSPGGGGGSSSSSFGGSGASSSGGATDRTDTATERVVLALRTLGSYDFGSLPLLPFVSEAVTVYLADASPAVRREAVLTCARLCVAPARDLPHKRGRTGRLIDRVLQALLAVGVSDSAPGVRLTVFTSLPPPFDAFLVQAHTLRSLFVALNDSSFPVREAVLAIIGRVSKRNPAYTMPSLRISLGQLLTELRWSADSVVKEQSAKLLRSLLQAAPRLCGRYVRNVLPVLLPRLRDDSPAVASAALATAGELARVGGAELLPAVPEMLAVILDTLADQSSAIKRTVALRALGQLAQGTGIVIAPYHEYPFLLATLLDILRSGAGTPWSLRQEVIRTLGILGALDPLMHARHQLSIGKPKKAGTAAAGREELKATGDGARHAARTGRRTTGETREEARHAARLAAAADAGAAAAAAAAAAGAGYDDAPGGAAAAVEDASAALHAALSVGSSAVTSAAHSDMGPALSAALRAAAEAAAAERGPSAAATTKAALAVKAAAKLAAPAGASSASSAASSSSSSSSRSRGGRRVRARPRAAPAAPAAAAAGAATPTAAAAPGAAATPVVVEEEAETPDVAALTDDDLPGLRDLATSLMRREPRDLVMLDEKSVPTHCVPPDLLVSKRDRDHAPHPSSEAYYPTVAIEALMKILDDPSLSSHHNMAIQAVMFICKSLSLKCVRYLPAIIPPFLRVMHVCEPGLRDSLFQQLGVLISIVKQHVRSYLSPMLAVVHAHWVDSLESAIGLVEEMSLALKDEFKPHLRELVPRLLACTSGRVSSSIKLRALHALLVLGGGLSDYLSLILPSLVALLRDDSASMSVRRAALATLAGLCSSLNFAEYASRIVHTLVRLLESASTRTLRYPALDALCALVYQLGGRYTVFIPMVAKVLQAEKLRHDWYDRLVSALKRGDALPTTPWYGGDGRTAVGLSALASGVSAFHADDDALAGGAGGAAGGSRRRATGASSGSSGGGGLAALFGGGDRGDRHAHEHEEAAHFEREFSGGGGLASLMERASSIDGGMAEMAVVKKLHVNQGNLKKAWEASQRSTKEDWTEWIRRLSVELLRESPSPSLRSCSALAQVYHPLARELFNAAFLSCWTELFDSNQDALVRSLETAFQAPGIPPEILHTLLDLAEFMEHDDKGLPIDIRALAELAQGCHAYAKALHYKELEFHTNPGCIQDLISINNRLEQPEAADGILRYVKSSHSGDGESKVQEWWYEKLNRWTDALVVYSRRAEEEPMHVAVTLGRMRCLNSLGEYKRLLALASEPWLAVEATPPEKQQLALLATRACWATARWDEMGSYLSITESHAQEAAFYRVGLALHEGRWEEAQAWIDGGRRRLDRQLAGLVGESYQRAYKDCVTAQLLTEMEEILAYKRALQAGELEAPARSLAALRRMWDARLAGAHEDLDIWLRILGARSLLLKTDDDMDNWLAMARMSRRQKRPRMALNVLQRLVGDRELASLRQSRLHPKVALAYLEHRWETGQHRGLLERLNALASRISDAAAASATASGSSAGGVAGDDGSSLRCCHGAQLCSRDLHNIRVRIYRLMGDWRLALAVGGGGGDVRGRLSAGLMAGTRRSSGLDEACIADILAAHRAAAVLAPASASVWHAWAFSNFAVIEHYESERPEGWQAALNARLVPVVQALVRSIALGGGGRTRNEAVPDILRLLKLWFDYGNRPAVMEALESGLRLLSIDAWLLVIPQLIARLHSSRPHVQHLLSQLLARLAAAHPQALIYPLTVAWATPTSGDSKLALNVMAALREARPTLVDQALLLSKELIRVAILQHEQWHGALDEASRRYFLNKDTEPLMTMLPPLHAMMDATPDTTHELMFRQTYGRELQTAWEWTKKWRKTNSATDLNAAWDAYFRILRRLRKQMPTIEQLELQYVSPALLSLRELELAVPGTYLHAPGGQVININRVHPTLRVISSKQRPRRVFMRGSDGAEYGFLLKGHEDLRQDERASQLFGLVNSLLAQNRETSDKDLSITRYDVVPLSQNVGVVGWVPFHDTLHDLLREYRESRKILLQFENRLISQMAPDYERLTLMQKVEVFRYALDNTAGQDLYKVLWFKSKNSEAWLLRRTNYTRSLAVMSMVGYILGLGDRHLSNLMLDRFSGKILHIDFGDCFEVAMKRDKYPERIPFRLTRMLVNAMEVTGIEGNFRWTANAVMNMLRQHKDSLMALLEAFVHDPLINWRLLAAKAEAAPTADVPIPDVTSADIAAALLAGKVPLPTGAAAATAGAGAGGAAFGGLAGLSDMRGDGDEGKDDDAPLMPQSIHLNRGDVERALRSALGPAGADAPREEVNRQAFQVVQRVRQKLTGRDFGDNPLDVETQVDRLIQQATDIENLCQCYIGWGPFW